MSYPEDYQTWYSLKLIDREPLGSKSVQKCLNFRRTIGSVVFLLVGKSYLNDRILSVVMVTGLGGYLRQNLLLLSNGIMG